MIRTFSENVNAAFAKNEVNYDEYRALLSDYANDIEIFDEEGKAVSKKTVDAKIRQVQFDILGLPEHPSKRDIHRALKKGDVELFSVLEEEIDIAVDKGWHESEFFDRFVENRNIKLGDRNEFWTNDKVTLVASKVAGHHHDTTLRRLGSGKRYQVEVSTYRTAVGADLESYLLGRIDWSEFVNKCAQAFIIAAKNEIFAQTFGAKAGEALPEAFKGNGKLDANSKKLFDQKIQYVSMVNGNCDVVLVGTKLALKELNNIAVNSVEWLPNSAKEDVYKTGRIGSYENTTMIEVPQRIDPTEKFDGATLKTMIPDDTILILPVVEDKFCKLVDEGETEIDQITEGGEASGRYDDTIKYEVTRRFGVLTQLARYHGLWKLA